MSQPTSPSANRKNLVCRVLMLDDVEEIFYVPNKSLGGILFTKVVQKIQLLEADYFDLQYRNVEGILCWLDHEKPITSHMPQNNLNFEFVVKFYTPDPGMLEEELTRYLFALQVKRDLATGRMPCQEQTAALLASYIVQAEFGDLTDEGYESSPDYLKSFKLFPNINQDMESRIIQHHREHFGQTPMDADYNLLDTARKVEFYGICMHDAKDHESVALHLAVTHMGVVVFQNMTRINTFSWAKIRKLSFKRKKFLIKLHPEGYGFYKDTVEFYFNSRNECKNFWKKCLEHHAFFRCHSVKKIPRNKTRVVSHGSSFRYSGKTQKQLVDFVRENFSKRPSSFLRSTSMRTVNFGGGATPRTGTLRSLRHSHQPQHDSPQQFDERPCQLFSPVKHDYCSSATFQFPEANGTNFMSMQKNSHTLPKESKPSAAKEMGKNQVKSIEDEKAPPIKAKGDNQPSQDNDQSQQGNIEENANLGQIMTPEDDKFQESLEASKQEGELQTSSLITIIPEATKQLQPLSLDDSIDNTNLLTTQSTPPHHQQFQFCHEIQQQPQNQNNCLPSLTTVHFPVYPLTPNISPILCNNNRNNEVTTSSPAFSKSLTFQISGHASSQPRYFCTDIDSCDIPVSLNNMPIQKLYDSTDMNIQFDFLSPSTNPHHLNSNESNSLATSEALPHKSLEILRSPVNYNQQQNKSHSINFLSKKVPSSDLSSSDCWNVSALRPSSHVMERMTLSNETVMPCIDDSNFLSASIQLTSAGSGEVRPILNQLGESTDTDIKKVISIPGYYIGRELLMTERTYKRDLEIIVQGFEWMSQDMAGLSHSSPQTFHVIQEAIKLFDPIYQFHLEFLPAIEMRITEWENFCTSFEKRKIGDLFASNISMLRLYNYYLTNEEELLMKIYMTLNYDLQFKATFLKFENSRKCYQPVSAFLLKPYQRMQHYAHILNKFIEVCGNDHADLENCEESKSAILDVINSFSEVHDQMINLQKVCELQQNVIGIGDLIQLRPQFVREGCLQKLSDNGYHQRLFILFDDFLICASRRMAGSFQFVVHAHIPMENIQVEVFRKINNNSTLFVHSNQPEDHNLINNGFLIRVFGVESRIIEVAASSMAEKNKWIEDLNCAVSFARRRREVMSRKNIFDSTERIFNNTSLESKQPLSPTLTLSPVLEQLPVASSSTQLLHTNTMMFVCWHRNTSVSMPERKLAIKNCLSGFLLRKFKTSSGWQKLWVTFSNLCLFFYKSYKDEFPLASLPLLGYSISMANQSDGIDKNFVFKLSFKSHAYFFRAESQCTYERWMEVIGSTIESSRHFRLFSRLDSFAICQT